MGHALTIACTLAVALGALLFAAVDAEAVSFVDPPALAAPA